MPLETGKKVIREMCKEYGIDPDKAVISDLTTEQLIEIGEKAFETSDHPKGKELWQIY